MVTVAEDEAAAVWDLSGLTNAEVASESAMPPALLLTGHSKPVVSVAYSPSGRWIATGSKDATARIWDAQSGHSVRTLTGHGHWVLAVTFSPDAKRLLTASADHTARIWDLETGAFLPLTGHTGAVLHAAWSSDGNAVATGSLDRTARLWNVENGTLLRPPLIGHKDGVSSLAFSPDGTHLVTGSQDHTARIHAAFPWKLDEYPGAADQPLEERIAQYKAEYWPRFARQAGSRLFPERDALAGAARRVETRDRGEFNVAVVAKAKVRPARPIPQRNPLAGPSQIDLTNKYNAALNEAWQPAVGLDDLGQDLSRLPPGLQSLGGVVFDVRGVIQLGRPDPSWSMLPGSVRRIQIGRRLRPFHVLQGTANREREDAVIGTYRLVYADGQRREIEIRYGRDVRDWWGPNDPRLPTGRSQIAWTDPIRATLGQYIPFVPGPHASTDSANLTVRLFRTTYDNPRPSETVVGADFTSWMTQSAPFLVALTVE
ncbi:MAG: WD40 repeat domain-containing protein [Verrucomicrobia bacterium]|nr:WD40 repeat domain-containing protein [Verrucomicrobiota bacterium]